ncbi:hypothetical protein LOF24_27810 [Sinorhizobium meliloti SM11]|uniref:hypothetical protein n=1 Tax=Rhizobium meliloti TaxID=382 RepID=UPI0023805B10|nr:hypothetical protein [Sinorhizobium meliloti]MDE4561815.1 hypothetical protein [Sinorhizobium meliloti SM11]
MKILVLNCGSSSLKVGVFEIAEKAAEIFKATYDKFAAGSCFGSVAKLFTGFATSMVGVDPG